MTYIEKLPVTDLYQSWVPGCAKKFGDFATRACRVKQYYISSTLLHVFIAFDDQKLYKPNSGKISNFPFSPATAPPAVSYDEAVRQCDSHGSALPASDIQSGAVEDMKRRGVDRVWTRLHLQELPHWVWFNGTRINLKPNNECKHIILFIY